jgi:hypothetical protein
LEGKECQSQLKNSGAVRSTGGGIPKLSMAAADFLVLYPDTHGCASFIDGSGVK